MMDRGTRGLEFGSPLEPADLNKLLGNLMISHRTGMSYEDTRRKLSEKHDIERSPSIFTNFQHSFWEILNENLQQMPSNMSLAANLLSDIKVRVLSLLTPTTLGLREEMDNLLDEEAILTRASKGKLKLKPYAMGVLHILERICTPKREPEIKKLLLENDVLAIYKGIIVITDKMKVDMKKYAVAAGPAPVEEEDEETVDKIADYMYHLGGELPNTEAWLRKHFVMSLHPKSIVHQAFVGLLASGPEPYPETLMMHIPMLEALKRDYFQLVVAVSMVLTTLTYLPPAMCTAESRESSFATIMNLLKGTKSDGDLARVLPTIVDKIRNQRHEKIKRDEQYKPHGILNESNIISATSNSRSKTKVRRSVTLRVNDYLRESLATEGAASVPFNLHFIAKN
uniref:T-complex protein 11 n=1 Tax=Lygus hesperus TaxID=30085 RepID=A0A0A9XEK8_LYGHE